MSTTYGNKHFFLSVDSGTVDYIPEQSFFSL